VCAGELKGMKYLQCNTHTSKNKSISFHQNLLSDSKDIGLGRSKPEQSLKLIKVNVFVDYLMKIRSNDWLKKNSQSERR
jgi:hypothetical protein